VSYGTIPGTDTVCRMVHIPGTPRIREYRLPYIEIQCAVLHGLKECLQMPTVYAAAGSGPIPRPQEGPRAGHVYVPWGLR
jgi:hypothetical protein